MGVMLIIALELRRVLPKHCLEHTGRGRIRVSIPHFIQSFSVSHQEAPLSAQRVLDRQLIDEVKLLVQEVLRQLIGIRQALNTAVHEACVPKVAKAHDTVPRLIALVLSAKRDFLVRIIVLRTTRALMEANIFLEAHIVAILDYFALAD